MKITHYRVYMTLMTFEGPDFKGQGHRQLFRRRNIDLRITVRRRRPSSFT